MRENLWLTLVTCLAYCVDKEPWKAINSLKEQVRVLKEQQEKDKRILLNDQQRIRLAAKAKRLTRELLEAATVLFTPDTILAWYRKLIARKYDGSENCRNPGRPKLSQEIVDLVIRFKQENPHWGHTRIRDYIVHLGYKIGETTVKNILLENGLDPKPNLTRKTTWKEFIKSHWEVLVACDFFSLELLVKGRLVRCLVLFAIELFTRKVEILGIRPQPNGPSMEQIARNISGEGSPNLNSHAERFVRSVKEECLDHLILFSEEQLLHVLTEYLRYYHHERIHQGIDQIIEPQHEGNQGEIICIERLGRLLKSYHRKAA